MNSAVQFNTTTNEVTSGNALSVGEVTAEGEFGHMDHVYVKLQKNSVVLSTTIVTRQTVAQLISAILGGIVGAMGTFSFLFPKLEGAWPAISAKLARYRHDGRGSATAATGDPELRSVEVEAVIMNPIKRSPMST